VIPASSKGGGLEAGFAVKAACANVWASCKMTDRSKSIERNYLEVRLARGSRGTNIAAKPAAFSIKTFREKDDYSATRLAVSRPKVILICFSEFKPTHWHARK